MSGGFTKHMLIWWAPYPLHKASLTGSPFVDKLVEAYIYTWLETHNNTTDNNVKLQHIYTNLKQTQKGIVQ